jgi:hypothetical protein
MTPVSERTRDHIPIKNYMGESWNSASDVLNYLLKNKGLRQYLLKESLKRRTITGCAGWLNHPLLHSYINLRLVDNDKKFVRQVKRHIRQLNLKPCS